MSSKPILSERDHEKIDRFLGDILDKYKNNKITKVEAIANIAHVMAAMDNNERQEIDSYLGK